MEYYFAERARQARNDLEPVSLLTGMDVEACLGGESSYQSHKALLERLQSSVVVSNIKQYFHRRIFELEARWLAMPRPHVFSNLTTVEAVNAAVTQIQTMAGFQLYSARERKVGESSATDGSPLEAQCLLTQLPPALEAEVQASIEPRMQPDDAGIAGAYKLAGHAAPASPAAPVVHQHRAAATAVTAAAAMTAADLLPPPPIKKDRAALAPRIFLPRVAKSCQPQPQQTRIPVLVMRAPPPLALSSPGAHPLRMASDDIASPGSASRSTPCIRSRPGKYSGRPGLSRLLAGARKAGGATSPHIISIATHPPSTL